VIASTGVANTWITLVPYSAHNSSGIRNQDMPGGRSMCIDAMKLTPVRIELKPRMNAPITAGTTPLPVVVLYGV
jgi:hypothetical protein